MRTDAVQFGLLRRRLLRGTARGQDAAHCECGASEGGDARPAKSEDEVLHQRAVERLALHAWTALPDGQVDFVSERLAALTGAAAFDDDGIHLVHAGDRARTVAAWLHATGTGTPFDVEHRIHMLDGGVRWMRSRANPQRDGSGRVVKWHGFSEDVHDAKQAAKLLADRGAQLFAITNSVDQLIWTNGPDGRIEYSNQAWHDFTGVPSGLAVGGLWSPPDQLADGLRHPDDQDRCRAAWLGCLQTGKPYYIEYRLWHRSGQYRWILSRAHAVRDAAGRIKRWFGTVTDIHEIVAARDALARSREEMARARRHAEQASAAKSPWLAAASHDLRQPLQTMTLLESLLAKQVDRDGDAGQLVAQLNETLGTMSGMLDALLDLNRIEAGTATGAGSRAGCILVIEDDPDLRSALHALLLDEGHSVMAACSRPEALGLVGRSLVAPDLVLADYNLPGNLDGLQAAAEVRDMLARAVPAIILTGATSAATLRAVASQGCVHLSKPVTPAGLLQAVHDLLPGRPGRGPPALDRSRDAAARFVRHTAAADSVARLTRRQRDVMAMMLEGQPNKNIAADLGVSQRTVETHRSTVMRKMGVKSLPALARLAWAAEPAGTDSGSQLPVSPGLVGR